MNLRDAKKVIADKKQLVIKEEKMLLKEDPIIAVGAVIIFYLYIIPIIKILFYNYIYSFVKSARPKYNDELTKEIQKITNFPVEVYIVNTIEINAFTAGTKKIYMTDGLIKMLSHKEIIGVLLHECGHYANMDLKKDVFLVDPLIKMLTIFLVAGIIVLMGPAGAGIGIYLSFFFKGILRLIVGVTLGRKMEYLADSFATEHGYGKEMVSALEKMEKYLRKNLCGKKTNSKECDMVLKDLHTFDEHPEFWKRKLNINSEDLKYTKKALDEFTFVNIKKSYFELRPIWKKLKKDIEEYKQLKGL
jgi:Zn-dependent protease with chaperone function